MKAVLHAVARLHSTSALRTLTILCRHLPKLPMKISLSEEYLLFFQKIAFFDLMP
jgi:hypothetical protein